MRLIWLLAFLAACFVLPVSAKATCGGTPTLDADCGIGATISGTKCAGRITVGTGTVQSCTIYFSWSAPPSCFAHRDTPAVTSTNGDIGPYAVRSSTSSLSLVREYGGLYTIGVDRFEVGDEIAYGCVGQ